MTSRSGRPPAVSTPDVHPERPSLERFLELGRATLAGVELKDALLALFQAPDYKAPILPAAALELTALTRKSNVSYDQVARVIEKDPLIAASVLKLVQSPVYGGRARVQSLRDALSRLGINTLRDVVWQVVVGTRVFRAPAYAQMLERLQRHCVFTAHAARIVASHAGVTAEHAFLCGLLHDVGWSGALVAVSSSMPTPCKPHVLYTAVDKIHSDAGVIMAKFWQLAPEIVEVIEHHHDHEYFELAGLIPVLCVAEQFAEQFDFGVEAASADDGSLLGLDEQLVGRNEQAIAVLQLESKLEHIRTQIAEMAEGMRAQSNQQ